MKDIAVFFGTFKLPDEKASAIRVIGLAKIFKELGYKVILEGNNTGTDVFTPIEEDIGYYCRPKWGSLNYYYDAGYAITRVKLIGIENVKIICLYHVPPIAALKIFRFCRSNNIILIADTTELYAIRSLLKGRSGIINVLNFWGRVYISNKIIYNNIVISSYLENYYRNFNTMVIPILSLDNGGFNERTWKEIRVCYCGSPERKDLLLPIIQAAQRAQDEKLPIAINIVGCTKEQFEKENNFILEDKCFQRITFYGRVPHEEAVSIVRNSDFSAIIRPNKRYANAGFPTKLVEAFSCGAGVIATRTSDIPKYVHDRENGFLLDNDSAEALFILFSEICSLQETEIEAIRYRAFQTAQTCFSPAMYTKPLNDYIEKTKKGRL